MANQTVRIGSVVDAVQYDDADFDSAIETDQPMKAGTPVDPTDVLRLDDLTDLEVVTGPGAATDNAIVRWDGVTGRALQNSGVLINDSDDVALPSGATLGVGVATPTELLEVATDTDVSAIIGRAIIGYDGASADTVVISHIDNRAAATASIRIAQVGAVAMNALAGQAIYLRNANNNIVIINAAGLGVSTTAPSASPVRVDSLATYANNAAAVAGGLAVGDFYRTGGDPDLVCVVH